MKEFQVIIPNEYYSILNFRQEDLPGVAVINTALRNFQPKEVFEWHLSIMVQLEELIENGMPSKKEVDVVDAFGDFLDGNIKGADKEKPNGLFLARITWNSTRELIWRVYDPEIADIFLRGVIEGNKSPREFDYRMDLDTDWKMTEWHLKEWD